MTTNIDDHGGEPDEIARLLRERLTRHQAPAHLRVSVVETLSPPEARRRPSLWLPPALSAWPLRQTSPKVVALVDHLLDRYTDGEIARLLNAQGYCSGAGRARSSSECCSVRAGVGSARSVTASIPAGGGCDSRSSSTSVLSVRGSLMGVGSS